MKTSIKLAMAVLVTSAPWQGLLAQAAPAPATGTSSTTTPEEIVELTPFEVTAEADSGYVATQTLAGTRIRTDLRDVGSAISVITKEFLADIGATDNSTLLQYTTNAEVAGTRGTYAGLGNGTELNESGNLRAPGGAQRVRGLAAADNTRDFYVTDIPWDSYNVDRIDIQRGPNSILFGLGSPAGIVNATMRSALMRDMGSAEARVGSYGSFRASLDVNQEIIDNVLAIRVDGLWNEEKFRQEPAFQNDKRYYGALRFEPQIFSRRDFRTVLNAKYEHGEIRANRPRNIPPQDSITPWFRPTSTDPNNLEGGAGKFSVLNGYQIGSTVGTFSPWAGGLVNQQQPLWLIDGATNQLYRIYGGYVNSGALNAAGVPQGAAVGLAGIRYSDVFSQLTGFAGYATAARLTNYQYGQYRNMTLDDPTVFDFYNNLLDGSTKNEWEGWDAYNIDLSQTAFDDRIGVQLTYDRQKYNRGGTGLLGNSPTLNIDLLQNWQDYVVGFNNATNTNVANINYGRPFVAGGPGRGSSYDSDREYMRASLFGEVRARDFFQNDFLVKLLGKHRFNGIYADESYLTENRAWQETANSAAYSAYKTQGAFDAFTNLPPVGVIYLGPTLKDATTSTGANISRILADVTLQDGNIYQFDARWRSPTGVAFNAPWDVPAGPFRNTVPAAQQSTVAAVPIFNGAPVINPNTGQPYAQLTQVSNPANYIGWNSDFHNELLRYNDGENLGMLTSASKSLRETKSYAGTWQGFLWNDAIVPTLGWRYDEVKSKNVSASPVQGQQRGSLNLNPQVYRLPDVFPANQILKDHSTSGGVVVHLNRLLGDRDFLPLNVSLSYNKSSNFQVTDLRRDIYGTPISNPTGATKDYGITLSTKDGKYNFRAVKYETKLVGTNTELNSGGLTGTITNAMNWRNIKVYYMSLYDWNSAGQPQGDPFSGRRYQWDTAWLGADGRPVAAGNIPAGDSRLPATAVKLETEAEAATRRDASIAALNDLQRWLTERGYFAAWNYGVGPTTLSALQTRGQYETNPILPVPASVYDYRGAPGLQGFRVTADTQSEGYEFEFTANPLPNWRIAINASKTEAVRSNVGGPLLDELVAYMDALMAGPGGDLVQFNSSYSAGNELRFGYNNWRGQYTLLKLQENTAASELRKWRYNVVTNYTFREGRLKGFGVGAGYRWQDKVVIGYPLVPAGTLASFDLTKPYYGPSEDALDLWASYERRLTEKINWKIQLNVRNVGMDEDLIPISIQPDGQTWAAARISPTQEWFVTNTFSF